MDGEGAITKGAATLQTCPITAVRNGGEAFSLLDVERRGAGGLAAGIGGDLVDPRLGLPQ